MTHPIEFRDIYRHFGTEEVLRGLSFTVETGQIYAFLGRNGSGKTTALRILTGLLKPMHGESFVLGTNSQDLGPKDRQRIGYITEGHKLYRSLRIKEILAFESGTRPSFDMKFATEALGRCGLKITKHVGLLSRGQRAQLSLILAAADRPSVLIFDDPALGLDVVMRREFLDAMIDFLAGHGSTVLFSSHILTDVERIADRIGILDGGRLCVDASLEDLKTRVQKRVWVGKNGAAPPSLPEILRIRKRRDAFDLTLLDPSPELESQLQVGGATLGDASVPTLEDLFLDLTTSEESKGLLSPMTAMDSEESD